MQSDKMSPHPRDTTLCLLHTNFEVSYYSLPVGRMVALWLLHHNNEPSCEKTNNVVSDQVRHKPACTITEDC